MIANAIKTDPLKLNPDPKPMFEISFATNYRYY